MKYIKLILFFLIQYTGQTQVPTGYLGKNLSIGMGFRNTFLTRIYNKKSPDIYILNSIPIPLRTIPYIMSGYSIKTNLELYTDIEMINTRQYISRFENIKSALWGAGLKIYEKSRGSRAPAGYYALCGLSFMSTRFEAVQYNTAGIVAGTGTQYILGKNLILVFDYKVWLPPQLLFSTNPRHLDYTKFVKETATSTLLSFNSGLRWLIK